MEENTISLMTADSGQSHGDTHGDMADVMYMDFLAVLLFASIIGVTGRHFSKVVHKSSPCRYHLLGG